MSSFSPPDIAVFVEAMKAENYAPGPCNRALVLLRYGFELALRWKVPGITSNPVKEIKNLKDDNKIERFLTQEQTIRLLTAVRQSESEMLQHIVLFLIYTGARKRGVLDAKWQDIDWSQKSWRIPKTKSGKIRHVPLSSGAMELLQNLKMCHESEFCANGNLDLIKTIFANPKTGEPYVSFYYSWNAARIRAGLPDFRVHDLRHSCILFGQRWQKFVRGAGVTGPRRHQDNQPLCEPEQGAIVCCCGVGAQSWMGKLHLIPTVRFNDHLFGHQLDVFDGLGYKIVDYEIDQCIHSSAACKSLCGRGFDFKYSSFCASAVTQRLLRLRDCAKCQYLKGRGGRVGFRSHGARLANYQRLQHANWFWADGQLGVGR